MAVTKSNETAKLILNVQIGFDNSGNPVYRKRTLANLNPALADDDVVEIGAAIAALQAHSLGKVSRQGNADFLSA